MNKAYNLDFRVRGVSRLNKSADALNNHADALRNNARAMGQWQAVNGGSGGPGGGISGGRAGGGSGNRRNPNQPLDFGQSLRNLIGSTRFGAGGAMPLVGRSMDVIGSLFGMSRAMMNKLMIPVALAVGAITAFTKAVIFASQALLDFRKSMAVGGGTPGQTIAGMRLDSLTGGNSAEDARRLQGLSAGGGVEASILRGMGFFQPGGFGRNPNAMTGLFGVLSKLRGQSGGQQDFNIQQLGLENYAGLIKDASPDQFRRAANQQGAGIGGRADRQAAINFKLGINDVGIAFKKLAPILTPVLNFIGTAARVLSQFIRALTLTVRSIFWFIDKITFGAASRTGLIPALNSGPGSKGMANVDSALDAWERWLNSQSKGDNSQDRNTSALDANTRGVQANTQAIKSIFGGDAGARGAVPDAWRFRMLGEARMQRQTAALGPFYEW